jgi:hypothetical protein
MEGKTESMKQVLKMKKALGMAGPYIGMAGHNMIPTYYGQTAPQSVPNLGNPYLDPSVPNGLTLMQNM